MTFALLVDAKDQPRAFRWNGSVPRQRIDEWPADRGWRVPGELIELWTEVGGGELFESETILQPCLHGEDDIDEENEQLIPLGLPFDLMVFHRGMCISAVDQSSGEVIVLEPETFGETGRFASVDDWYRQLIRREFADRYGLPLLQ